MTEPEFDPAPIDGDFAADTLDERIGIVEGVLFLLCAEIAARHMAIEDLERRARELALWLEEMKAEQAKRNGRLQ